MDDQTKLPEAEEEKEEVAAPEGEEAPTPAVGTEQETPAVGEEDVNAGEKPMPAEPVEPAEGVGKTE